MAEGAKDDGGKLDYSLVDAEAEAELVAVLTHGAAKYEAENWRLVPDARRRHYSALRRHLRLGLGGQVVDPDSDLMHLAEAECCAHFLLALEIERHPELARSRPERLRSSLAKAMAMKLSREARSAR